ncbi:MAG TPA: homocysteine S-methyltransferase family protein, partial [Pirellulales bacterium]|nr:homocysteine S-methyltransferase family protein [Pirellulales bacterium]
MATANRTDASALLERLLEQRVLILDGAMGTMIQALRFSEQDYRGVQFADHAHDLKGCNDLLVITQSDAIESIHRQYFEAGADIVETNTFNANSISMADYGLESKVRAINLAAASCARRAADAVGALDPQRPRFVAGSIGPTNRTASISPDVNDPGFRNVNYDQLVAAYYEQISALVDGGVDMLMPETTFDTLNLRACLFAIEKYFDDEGLRLPVMVSVTITDRSGRTLSGQTLEAFWTSISHARLLSVGINCAFGPELMRPYVEELARIAPVYISCHPNAGLPNAFGGYDETPAQMARTLAEFADNGWLNIVGGCCGTTPDHIAAIAEALASKPPRKRPQVPGITRLSGLEMLAVTPESNFIMIGERTNVTGSKKFARLILNGQFEEAVAVARAQVDAGANVVDVNMDEALLDGEKSMAHFLNLLATEPDVARVPFMIDSSKWSVIESGLKCVQGKPIVNSISLKEGEAAFLRTARLVHRYGAAVVVMAFDEQGQATT